MKKFQPAIIFLNFFFLILFSFVTPVSAADTLYFFHTDHLGSTRVITDKTGTVVAQYDYWPYGSIKSQTTSSPTERLYTSQIFDQDSDLYFYNARYYNPKIGNFISADSADGSYVYVGGNPINSSDPSGNYVDMGAGGGGSVNQFAYTPYMPEAGISSSGTVGPNTVAHTPWNPYPQVPNPRGFYTTLGVTAAVSAVIPLGVAYGPAAVSALGPAFGKAKDFLSPASRAAARAEYIERVKEEAYEYGVTWTAGSPGGSASGCVKTAGATGTEILKGTQLHQLEVVVPNNVAIIGHEAGPSVGHMMQAAAKAFSGAPDVTLGGPLSLARIGYEIQASLTGVSAGLRYATSSREAAATFTQAYGVFWEATGGGFLFRRLGTPGIFIHSGAVAVPVMYAENYAIDRLRD